MKDLKMSAIDALNAVSGEVKPLVEEDIKEGIKQSYMTKHIPCDYCGGYEREQYINKCKAFDWRLKSETTKEERYVCIDCMIKMFDKNLSKIEKSK